MPNARKGSAPGPERVSLKGRRFGRLKVVELHHVVGRHGYWTCQCDCGSQSKEIRDTKLTSGRTVSCGCWRANPAVRQAARLVVPAERRQEIARMGSAASVAAKNPAAVALGRLGGVASAARRTPARQAEIAARPRKPSAYRCPCGAMTAKRALARWPARAGCCNNPGCLPATVSR